MKLLCTADLHIGRRSTLACDPGGADLSCAGAWRRLVQTALRERVDAVLIAGDLVDRGNALYEALAPVAQGLTELARAGIVCCVVAGNHDHAALPRLIELVGPDALVWLGRGGDWEATRLSRPSGELHVHGWSFPDPHYQRTPFERYALRRGDGAPTIGLVHADLGGIKGNYAPVSAAELAHHRLDLWVLGHLHPHRPVPAPSDGRVVGLYPGSPQALDPTETGAHGASLVTLAPGREPEVRLIPLSTVRYEQVELDLTGVAERNTWDRQVVGRLREVLDTACPDGPAWVSCRVRYTGATPVCREVAAWSRELVGQVCAAVEATQLLVEQTVNETRPLLDLASVARGDHPPAVLARLLAAIERGDPEAEPVVEAALRKLAQVHQTYVELGDPPPDPETARRRLAAEGYRLLAELLAQRSEA